MKIIKILLWSVCLFLVSCYSEKDKYLDRYQQFATEIMTNSSFYTAEDWENFITAYEKLKSEYVFYSRDMTVDERIYVEELNKTINKELARNAAVGTLEWLKGTIDSVSDIFNELLE